MSRKYKFYDKSGLYFVSFATVQWMDVFVRELYFETFVESLKYCRQHLGMEIYCWCIMPSHVHLIFSAKNNNPGELMKSLKTFTSKNLRKLIADNGTESRKEWLLDLMAKAGSDKSNVKHFQFWQQDNHPIELWSASVIDQKVDYIHNNPVVAGFVWSAENWKYSSAINYAGGVGMLEIDFIG
jgi:putative transposase